MTETVQLTLDAVLLDRIRRFAATRGWSQADAVRKLIEHGLFACESTAEPSLSDLDASVLQSAIAALEVIPDDPGFSLIGRAETAGPHR